ncbi:MAG: nucleoside triphosphate pyrophosphohydrolase family protein [Patescibacteria group bacterium]|nr:nucleoside triphosphate pyrophosphohydrolase family protein [Patescibacteria group bacterium]
MIKQLNLVDEFHKKFHVPTLKKPSLIPEDRSDLRFGLMEEEVREYKEGVRDKDLENIAKEMCDILYAVYGTILEHGLQDVIEDIFNEVHNSHMSKDYHQYKMLKGEKYFKPDVKKFLKNKLFNKVK